MTNIIEAPTTPPVMAITDGHNNASLIVDCARLGYLQPDWLTLDPTYGLGRFWNEWKPNRLIGTDLNPDKSPIGKGVDFRYQPWPDAYFDAVVFDPPYKYNGTPAHPSDADYGVDEKGIGWQETDRLVTDGITECIRILKPGGMLLVKCQDQVVCGHVRWQTHTFTNHAISHGCRLVDALLLRSYRPQPKGRKQVHARRNYSTLLVLKKRAYRKQEAQ